jgi:hypothetical protein
MQLMGLYFHRILPVQRQIPHGEGKAETRSSTVSDMDPQDQEEPAYETATETAGSQIDIAINVSPEEGVRFGRS